MDEWPITADVPLLAHRGLWSDPSQRNTLAAFENAFAHGWGAELDVRDLDGALVVSHDPPAAGALAFDRVVAAHRAHGCPGVLAVNVKADGLAEPIAAALREVPGDRWFAFDMSVPDMLHYVRADLPVFTRHSDIEPSPALYADAAGVWVDDFRGGFIDATVIAGHRRAGKRVAVVSPELHRRDHAAAWRAWRTWPSWRSPDLMLCTDHPTDAQETFS